MIERAAALFRTRHLRGEVDRRRVAARIVFVGARVLTVEAEGKRHSFHFDVDALDRTRPIELTDWYSNAAGDPVATTLLHGDASWNFDAAGRLVAR